MDPTRFLALGFIVFLFAVIVTRARAFHGQTFCFVL